MATAAARRSSARVAAPARRARTARRDNVRSLSANGGAVALPRLGGVGALGRRAISLPDTSLITGIARGRKWIVLVAVLLLGIVALNVSLLSVNADISQMALQSQRLVEDNARLRSKLAKLSSPERIINSAKARGFVAPEAISIKYISQYPYPNQSQRRAVLRAASFAGG